MEFSYIFTRKTGFGSMGTKMGMEMGYGQKIGLHTHKWASPLPLPPSIRAVFQRVMRTWVLKRPVHI